MKAIRLHTTQPGSSLEDSLRSRIRKLEEELSFYKSIHLLRHHRIRIPLSGETLFIPCQKVVMIRSASNYSIFHLADGEKIITAKTLKHWQGVLPDELFVRCHNSFMINRFCMESYQHREKTFMLCGGCEAKVSVRYLDQTVRLTLVATS